MKLLTEQTVLFLLNQLHDNAVPYAILRNYEYLPHVNNDLDLVCEEKSINKIKDILVNALYSFGWEFLVESTKCKSPKYHQSLTAFFLINSSTQELLQIDLFGGIHYLGLQLFSAKEMISRRTLIQFNQVLAYKICEGHELVTRCFHYDKGINKFNSKKLNKIRNIIQLYSKPQNIVFFNDLFNRKQQLNLDFLNAIQSEASFKKIFRKFRSKLILDSFLNTPLKTSFSITFRIIEVLIQIKKGVSSSQAALKKAIKKSNPNHINLIKKVGEIKANQSEGLQIK